MNPSSFPQANDLLLGSSNPPVSDLPIFRGVDDRGNLVVISCWELTDEEVGEVARTRRVWLHVHAPTHPPLYVGGTDPFPGPGRESQGPDS